MQIVGLHEEGEEGEEMYCGDQVMSRSTEVPELPKVPGIDGFVQGQPWPSVVGPQPVRPRHERRLASIQSVLNNSIEAPVNPASSPASATGNTGPSLGQSRPDNEHYDGHWTPAHTQREDSPLMDQELSIPNMARAGHGGCIDQNGFFFSHVQKAFGNLSLQELEYTLFARTPRAKYGENHASIKSKNVYEVDTACEVDASNQTPNERHRVQERDRRVRHRALQDEFDKRTPDSIVELTERTLADAKQWVKSTLAEEQKTQELGSSQAGSKFASDKAVKRAGKDDNLLAAAFLLALYALVVFRERQERCRLQTENSLLSRQHSERDSEIAWLRRQLAERDNELMVLRQQIRDTDAQCRCRHSSPFVQLVPQPHLRSVGIKRTAGEGKGSAVLNAADQTIVPLPAKRPRMPGGYQRHPQQNHPRYLPPSPSPSCDDVSSSSCSH